MSAAKADASLIRQARIAEALTVAWMVVELAVALWAGIAARSIALTTFGVDSGIELFTAAVVLRLFVLHTERANEEELDARGAKRPASSAGASTASSPTSSPLPAGASPAAAIRSRRGSA